MIKVHYFFDPMCGWCYAASPLIHKLAQSADYELVYHPGGMIPRRAIEPEFRQHILEADKRIAEQTHALFGVAYKERVASSDTFILDSYITTKAFMAGTAMGIAAHLMLSALQKAHYQKGMRLEQPATLKSLALSLGLDGEQWELNMASLDADLIVAIENSQSLMQTMQVSGYPSLVSEVNGNYKILPNNDTLFENNI